MIGLECVGDPVSWSNSLVTNIVSLHSSGYLLEQLHKHLCLENKFLFWSPEAVTSIVYSINFVFASAW